MDAWLGNATGGYAGFKRNVAVALGEAGEPPEAAVAALREVLQDLDPLARERAIWTLRRWSSRETVDTRPPPLAVSSPRRV